MSCTDLDATDFLADVIEECSTLAGTFDRMNMQTPIALRVLVAYKCDYQGDKEFATAEA